MALDETLIAKAADYLSKKFGGKSQRIEIVEELLSYRASFEDMEADELRLYAFAAATRVWGGGSASAPQARAVASGGGRPGQQSGPGGGARPAASGPARTASGIKPSAPFRFVVLPDQVALAAETDRLPLDLPRKDAYCARIEVVWAAEAPLLIGEENQQTKTIEPMKIGNDYVIPGASYRGLIRSAMEIVALGRLGAANLHHRYGLRDFEHPAYGDPERSPVAKLDEVKAGWLELVPGTKVEDKKWQIVPIGGHGEGWFHILIENMRPFGARDRESWIDTRLLDKYQSAGMLRHGAVDFRSIREFSAAGADKYGRRLLNPGGPIRGVPVFAGKLPKGGGEKSANKKHEYVFIDRNPGKPEQLNEETTIADFERLNCKPSKNRPEPDGSWADLIETLKRDGGRLPVFYVGNLADQGPDFAFGLTRLFKIPHRDSVGDVLARQGRHLVTPTDLIDTNAGTRYAADLVENLFGYVVEAKDLGIRTKGDDAAGATPAVVARKGRIAFSFGHLVPGSNPAVSAPIKAVMMAPRASFAPYYLKSIAEKDYSSDRPLALAGRKRYLPRWKSRQQMRVLLDSMLAMAKRQEDRGVKFTDKITTSMRFLVPADGRELRFRSEIRMTNVSAFEIGAVLFALTHGGDPKKPCRHMVGRARPFGAGQMRIDSARLEVHPNVGESSLVRGPALEEVASQDGLTGWCPSGDYGPTYNASHRPFIDCFIEYMRKHSGMPNYPNVPHIKEFLGASDPAEASKIPLERLDYMELKDFNKLRKDVKPEKSKDGKPARAPAKIDGERDGRLLPAPERQFWR